MAPKDDNSEESVKLVLSTVTFYKRTGPEDFRLNECYEACSIGRSFYFTPHPHAGDKWCIYPSYYFTDYTVGSVENTVSQSRAPTLVFDDENETISEIHATYDPEKVIKPKTDLGFSLPDPIPEATSHAVFLDAVAGIVFLPSPTTLLRLVISFPPLLPHSRPQPLLLPCVSPPPPLVHSVSPPLLFLAGSPSARLSEIAEPTFEFQSEPPLLTAINVHHIPPLDAAPFCKSRTTKSTHLGGRLARSGGLCVSEASPSLRSVSWPSQFCEILLCLDESYVSRYGNIRVHFLSWSLVCTPSWLIFRNIASPLPRRLGIPIPFESRCRVFSSSHFVTGAIRFQGPSYLFASAKSRTFILSGSVEIYLVSSWNLDVGARAVHARSRSFQTLPFGIINVGFDHFMLVIVTYSEIHLMLPTVLQWMSKTLLFSFVITCFMFCFMMFIKPSRIPPVLILLPLSLAPNVMVSTLLDLI
ncbi:hypothetical protein F2Q70_00030742 [Brassica cretica]|uniref:Uncharacterized protein n=1 Tax=Brassica cretica TaxID=69181 RepID=A0A8S9FQP0_BRACR|nr:hypothetical protein F2Q70_00030742 [Brassica cretica]